MPPLADHIPDAPNLGWFLGLGIGSLVVVVVAALVGTVLTFASRLREQTEAIRAAVEGTAGETVTPGRGEHDAAVTAGALVEAARTARRRLAEG